MGKILIAIALILAYSFFSIITNGMKVGESKGKAEYVDNCAEYLSYSDEDRVSSALAVLTNTTPVKAITIATLLALACRGEMPEYSRAEANNDAGAFLPYFRNNCHTVKCEIKAP